MLLITNINGEAIVADGEFLKEVDSESLKELNRSLDNGNIVCNKSGKINHNGKSMDLEVQQIFTILGNFTVYSNKEAGISSLIQEEYADSESGTAVSAAAGESKSEERLVLRSSEESEERLNLGSSKEIEEEDTIVLGTSGENKAKEEGEETVNLFAEDKEQEEDDIDLDSLFESLADKESEAEQEPDSEADKTTTQESTDITSEAGEEDILGDIEDFFSENEEAGEAEEKVGEKTEEKAEEASEEDESDILSDLENILAEELESEEEKSDETESAEKREASEKIDDLDILEDLDILSEAGEDKEGKKDESESSEDELTDIFELEESKEQEAEEKEETTQDEKISEADDLLGMLDDELSLTDIKIDEEGEEDKKTELDNIDIIPLADETDSESVVEENKEESEIDTGLDDIVGLMEDSETTEEEPVEKSGLSELEEDIIPLAEDVESEEESGNESLEILETPTHTENEIPSIEELTAEEETETEKVSAKEAEVANIVIDLEDRAKLLEIDTEEYKSLFMDFISDAREMKESLLVSDTESIRDTVSILKDAVLLLQLQALKDMLADIEASDSESRKTAVDRFYLTLDAIESEIEAGNSKIVIGTPSVTELAKSESTVKSESVHEAESVTVEPEKAAEIETPTVTNEEVPAAESEKIEEQKEEVTETPPSDKLTADDILDGVKPIPIEFSLHIASEELSLPEDLVLEFISDFAQQAHENLPVLIEEYRNNELDKLQKTAHMLKGAASNLRIEQMVDNLYQLQYDNDIDNAPDRIRLFAGQLMGLDNYLKQMNVK